MVCMLALLSLMHCDFVIVRAARIAHLRLHSCILSCCVLCSLPSASYFIRVVMNVAIYIISVVSRSAGVQCFLAFSSSSSVSVVLFTCASLASTLPFTVSSAYVTRYLLHCVHSHPIPHPISLYPRPFLMHPLLFTRVRHTFLLLAHLFMFFALSTPRTYSKRRSHKVIV